MNKKGFTLIELLATIVVLAIVLVITVPTVLNSMSSVRQDALKASADSSSKYYREQLGMLEIGMRQEDFIIDAKLDDNGRIISRLERCITKEEAKILGLNTKDYSINQACTGKETLSNECNNLTNYSTVRWNSNKEAIVKLVGELNGKFTKGNKRLVAISGTQSSGDLNEFEETENPVLTGTTSGSVIRNLKMYGNSIQSGIPTPDAPIDIESVGDKSKNLFNANAINNSDIQVKDNGKTIIMPVKTSGNGYTYTGSTLSELCPDLKVGDTVILSFNTNVSTNRLIYLDNVKEYWYANYTKTITQEMLDSNVSLYANRFIDGDTEQKIITDFQIELGNTVTEYEPYGYKIPVKVSGKNLLDVQNNLVYHNNAYVPSYTWEKTETGFKVQFLTAYENGSWLRHGFNIGTVQELAGKTITVSYEEYIGSSQQPIILVATTNLEGESAVNFDNVSDYKTGYIGTSGITTKIAEANARTLTCTIPEISENKYVGIFFYLNANGGSTQIGDTVEYKNLQIEIGSNATEYEPYVEPNTTNIYLNEPLRAIGSYRDYIDFENGKVIRNIKEFNLTGNENWELRSNTTNTFQFQYSSIVDGGLCSHYPKIAATKFDQTNGVYLNYTRQLIISDINYSTVEDFKSYLKGQYNKGTPVKLVIRPVEQPREEEIELPTIKTVANTTYISVNSTIKPTLESSY